MTQLQDIKNVSKTCPQNNHPAGNSQMRFNHNFREKVSTSEIYTTWSMSLWEKYEQTNAKLLTFRESIFHNWIFDLLTRITLTERSYCVISPLPNLGIMNVTSYFILYFRSLTQSAYFAESTFLKIFPAALFGMASRKTTPPSKRLNLVTRSATKSFISCSVALVPAFATTNALGNSPAASFLTAMTAASDTFGWLRSISSNSAGATCQTTHKNSF